MKKGGTTEPLQPPSFDPKLSGWNPPRPFRLLHGSFLPELAHRSEIESGPMTLTRIIFWRPLTSAAGTLPRTG